MSYSFHEVGEEEKEESQRRVSKTTQVTYLEEPSAGDGVLQMLHLTGVVLNLRLITL